MAHSRCRAASEYCPPKLLAYETPARLLERESRISGTKVPSARYRYPLPGASVQKRAAAADLLSGPGMKQKFKTQGRDLAKMISRLAFRPSLVLTALTTTVSLVAGTVSPQLAAMDRSQSVQVIVTHTPASLPSLLSGLLSPVCGVLNLIEILPLGELCTMTVGDALNLANNPAVAHISVNNTLTANSPGVPVYDYTPQTLQPSSTVAGTPNPAYGKNIGVAVIDSGIHVNADLMSPGLL